MVAKQALTQKNQALNQVQTSVAHSKAEIAQLMSDIEKAKREKEDAMKLKEEAIMRAVQFGVQGENRNYHIPQLSLCCEPFVSSRTDVTLRLTTYAPLAHTGPVCPPTHVRALLPRAHRSAFCSLTHSYFFLQASVPPLPSRHRRRHSPTRSARLRSSTAPPRHLLTSHPLLSRTSRRRLSRTSRRLRSRTSPQHRRLTLRSRSSRGTLARSLAKSARLSSPQASTVTS